MFRRGCEIGARFGLKILNFKFCGDADVWLRIFVMLSQDSEDEM